MILIASLFDGTATNRNFNPRDAYSSPTKRQKYIKTRFFVGWTSFYVAILLLIAYVFLNNWHLPILELLSTEDVQKAQSWIIPASQRLVQVINASYCRELLLLLTLICYDQDAHTSISMAVVISFLPTLAISLARHILSVLEQDSLLQLPSYLILDDATFRFANFACLLAAHAIMYLSWMKTLHGWFAEQDLFKMRYNLLADKYEREVSDAVAARSQVPVSPVPQSVEPQPAVVAPRATSESKPARPSAEPVNRAGAVAPRRPSSDSKSQPTRLASIGSIRSNNSSFQELISSTRINLDSRGQSLESTSLLSVAQLKIGTPTLVPVDDGLECFSYVGKTIALWDLHTLAVKTSFVGHTEPATKIKPILLSGGPNAVSARFIAESPIPRVNVLISASWDGTIKLWNVATAECIATLSSEMGGITSINTYDNDTKLIAGSAQGKVALWDLHNRSLICEPFSLPPGTISAVGMWADQSKFFAASFDGCAYVWNAHTRKCEKILKKHTKRILDAVLYDSDTRLITASEDTLVVIWDLENGNLLRTLEGHSTAVNVVAVYGDSQRAITGSSDGQLIAWDIYTEEIGQLIVSSLDDHTAAIISIHVFEDDFNKMYTHSMDRKLRVWDMAANICERVIDMPPANSELEVIVPSTKLRVLVAWNPADGPSIDTTAQFIRSQGHDLTLCKNAQELREQLASSTQDFNFAVVDLTLPQLDEDHANSVITLLNTQGSKLVLLTTSDLTNDPQLSHICDLFKSASGFLELTEKPITELSLAKMLDEVADSLPEEVSTSPTRGNTARSAVPASGDFAVMPRQGGAFATPNRPGRAESEWDLQRLSDRLNYIESLFACFVPVEFFELISPKGRDRTQLGDAVCKSVTVLFSDIRDFSSMSETMAVSELMEFLNAYLAFAMPPIQENGGFVDKFIGDSIMALFSQDGTQQCISAVNCAISMMSHLDTLQDNGFTQVATGIGINTGRMIIGLVGVETRMEPTVLGDAVNLASRLESLCKVYDSRVIISQYTREKMGRSAELYTLRELDLVAVKGKKLACRIYEILEADRKESQKGKRMLLRDGLWDNALRTYRDGNWDVALGLFEQCLQIWPMDRPSKLYVDLCKTALNNGIDPRKWDSTNRLSFK